MLKTNEHYIICVCSEYLVACPYVGSSFLRFSNSPYDGYPFNEFITAWHLSRRMNGMVVKHNRATGKIEGGWK